MRFKRENWLDAVKGIAGIIVFLQHFSLAFANDKLWIWREGVFRIKPLHFMVNGNFAVNLFLIISFYLTSKSILQRELSTKDVGRMAIKRYVRLVIPVAVCSVFVLVVSRTVGFYNQKISLIDNNSWLDDYYEKKLTLRALIKSALYGVLWNGDYTFNGPFWMLTTLFTGFFLTIIITCVIKHINKPSMVVLSLMVLFLIYYFQCSMQCSSILGTFLGFLDTRGYLIGKKKQTHLLSVAVFFLLLLSGYTVDFIKKMPSLVRAGSYLRQAPFWYAILAFLVLLVGLLDFSDCDLQNSNRIVLMGKHSMGLYLFHWPIICSVSCKFYMQYVNNYPTRGGFWIFFSFLMVITFLLTMGVSFLYTIFIEEKLIKWINAIID